jgi:hypothetical protein
MFKKIVAATLLLALLCPIMVETTLAQLPTVTPGVTKGNTFTYDVKGLWSSNDPNVTITDQIRQLNMTDYFQVEITDVSGSEVSMNTMWRFTNGTELNGNTKIDISTGIYSGNSSFWAIFPGNLNAGDRIHPIGPDQVTVNGSQTTSYGSNQRETNRIVITGEFASNDNSNRTYNDYMNVQFDKQTGMLVALNDQQVYTNPEYTATIIWKITDSNVWTVPEFPVAIIALPLFMIVTLLALIAFKKRSTTR